MFERRLKIFLSILVTVTAVLVLRAVYVQVVQKDYWRQRAEDAAKRARLVETRRGSIVDVHGIELAVDQLCIDACVDFRALSDPPDKKWVESVASERVLSRPAEQYRNLPKPQKKRLFEEEVARVRADIDQMWARLAETNGTPLSEVLETRKAIISRVNSRKKYIAYRNYLSAKKKFDEREPPAAWQRWLASETADAPTESHFAEMVVTDEVEAHPVLRAISTEVQNELRKRIEQYPGLALKTGVKRYYPYGDVGSHVLGQLARVSPDDLKADPNAGRNELRKYFPNDLIGRDGVERLAEPLLRGSRGKIETIEGREGEVGRVEHVPGQPVTITLDIELQNDVINMFRYAKVQTQLPGEPKPTTEIIPMHGAAVVIDIPSSEVRVLASYPTYDANTFDENYAKLSADKINTPLLNRATQSQLFPGSTVKPIVGIAAVTEGLIGVNEGIECTGFLTMGGKPIRQGFRCWTASKFADLPPAERPPPEHHKIPYQDPHVGHHGNPDGHLTFADAVQRSCNVYFEQLGDLLRLDGLTLWYSKFGLGRRTGIGIAERTGRLPLPYSGIFDRQQVAWHSAIGQVRVTASPLQMANVAATIARNGVWMRPKLLREESELLPRDTTISDRVDLGLSPEAVAAAREGMVRVVNTEAGTGRIPRRKDMVIAGKTGTATASELKVERRGPSGETWMEPLRPATRDEPNPETPWYRGGNDGKTLNHAWFIGFAPAENPTVAFAVMVEYGGSGGTIAGPIVNELLNACIEHGCLKPQNKPAEVSVR